MSVAPPPPRLPPLSHLRAAVLAARLGGYAAAGHHLGVSAGAIRAKIRALEAAIDQRVFQPHARRVELTETGKALVEELERGFAVAGDALALLCCKDYAKEFPWNALPGLEAALRLRSFLAAANELGCTSRAVSGQVKRAEVWAGQPFFDRHARGVHVQEFAATSQPAFAEALTIMRNAVLSQQVAQLRIAALPAVAQLWLTPRLQGLRDSFPNLRVSISALEQPPTGKTSGFDLAIFMGGVGGIELAKDFLVPVCAPGLAGTLSNPNRDATHAVDFDLHRFTRLNDAKWRSDWRDWFAATGHTATCAGGITHSLYSIAVADALSGAGVLIGHTCLLDAQLQDGSLIEVGPRVASESALKLHILRNTQAAQNAAEFFRQTV